MELVDVDYVTKNMKDVLNYMKDNDSCSDDDIRRNFSEFGEKNYAVLELLISRQDISPLIEMLKTVHNIKNKKISEEDGERNMFELMNEKYVYPHLSK